jgi:hypothetical protein
MPPVGFEPTIPVLERAKTGRALDRAATAIGEVMNKINFYGVIERAEKTAWEELKLAVDKFLGTHKQQSRRSRFRKFLKPTKE